MDKIKILLTGGSGTLGKELLKIYDKDKYIFLAPTSKELDITKIEDCIEWFKKNQPQVVIHCAAYVKSKESEIEYMKSINTNIIGTCNIINGCDLLKIKLIYISSDYVFDGNKGNYCKEDFINPITNYSKSKAAGELATLMYKNSLVIRTSFYPYTFPYETAFIDQWTSKDYINIIAPKILNLCFSEKFGISHCGTERKTIYELAIKTKKDVKKSSRKDINYYVPKDTSFNEKDRD